MQLLPEDPRLTAYALGEIEDESERNAIEAAVEQSPELQAAVASIRKLGDLLSAGFAEEPAPELSEFEKAKMEAPQVSEQPSSESRLLVWPVWTSAAAILLLAFVLLPQRSGVKEDFAYQAEPRTAAEERTVTRMRVLEVDIPAELIEGTPQPIKVPNLEPTPTQAPQLVMQETIVVGRDGVDEDLGPSADALMDDFAFSEPVPAASPVPKSTPAMKVLAMPQKAPVAHRVRMNPVANIAVAEVDIKLPDMEQSLTVSSGPASVDSDASMNLVGTPREGSHVNVFGLKTMSEEEALRRFRQAALSHNTETYAPIEETDFRSPLVAPLSTFSIDVDTASYANVRRFLNQGQLPPADAVRIEECINYFPYSDAAPTESLAEGGAPFAVHMEQTIAPWNTSNHLLRVALKGYEMPWEQRPASNLVFLLDVSGSMRSQNKLPLVKEAMDLLVRRLDGRDRVAVVVYAGASGLALPSTTANNRETIQHAMDHLNAGGSTNGGAGVQLAYKVAREHFIEGGNNRVILCTDGDFNVGQTNQGDLADVAEAAADEGVSLTILGFGMGNFKDDMLEELSNKGKGTYAYVDSSAEARKIFLEDLASNIFKIAKDVKIQVEFNPAHVQAYRLIGYENRRLKAGDFNNDAKKAGDIGPGHTVVALYEIVPAGVGGATPSVDALRYQENVPTEGESDEVATVKLRYKQPEADVSQLITRTVESDDLVAFDGASADARFGAAVAGFGMRLRGSEHANELSYDTIESIAASALGKDSGGHRSEFVGLVRKARELSGGKQSEPAGIRCGVE
jgi:Ca-activated chloride channel family protein